MRERERESAQWNNGRSWPHFRVIRWLFKFDLCKWAEPPHKRTAARKIVFLFTSCGHLNISKKTLASMLVCITIYINWILHFHYLWPQRLFIQVTSDWWFWCRKVMSASTICSKFSKQYKLSWCAIDNCHVLVKRFKRLPSFLFNVWYWVLSTKEVS